MSDTAASKCAERENSTDCLLRLLLQTIEDQAVTDDAKFDWDPVTFAFTVVIGFFAALFALVTIYQATLAAGPGRRKCNHRAIGYWATKTKREWSWNELNRLSIATTPVLRAKDVLEMVRESEGREEMFDAKDTKAASSGSESRPPAATWLRFLNHAGLEGLARQCKYVEHTTADYLAGDLLAVPAYADIGFIVAAGAASGGLSYRNDWDPTVAVYPAIRSAEFQFDFRQHPTLGTVGVFSRHGNAARPERNPISNSMAIDQLRFTLECSLGELRYVKPPAYVSTTPQSLICRTVADGGKGLKDESLRHHPSLHDHGSDGLPCLDYPPRVADDHGLEWMMETETPGYVPVIFPSRPTSRKASALAMLALNGGFWSSRNAQGSRFPQIVNPVEEPLRVRWSLETVEGLDESKLENGETTLRESRQRKLGLIPAGQHDASFDLFHELLDWTWLILRDFDDFETAFDNSMDTLEQKCLRVRFLLQIQQLDRVLASGLTEEDLRCRTCRILQTTLMVMRIDHATSPNRGGKRPSFAGRDDEAPEQATSQAGADIVQRHQHALNAIQGVLNAFPDLGHDDPTLLDSSFARDIFRRFRLHPISEQILAFVPHDDAHPDFDRLRLANNQFRVLRAFMSSVMNERSDSTNAVMGMDDIIIWRAVLIAALYWTAPDNSDSLSSGVWSHIVPII
ncbi:hypothetical protein B0T14DRAFT_314164 [Immersiella caudata]|uniref:Uncharacterized protein n=1 Tax=Immersiella caudata TaxID=314043 RepID=A0AA39WBV4_9PEZI|nr:hypothetical protein B0T14DRAFT_314164 [Immersiella caudata]